MFDEARNRLDNHDERISNNERRIGNLEDNVDTLHDGIVMSAAIASHQFNPTRSGLQLALGMGHFDSQSAGSLGIGGRLNDRVFLSALTQLEPTTSG